MAEAFGVAGQVYTIPKLAGVEDGFVSSPLDLRSIRRARGRADPYKTPERRAREVTLQMISTLILNQCTQLGLDNPEISYASVSTARLQGSSPLV